MTRAGRMLVCALALVPACEGSEIGNPFEESKLALTLRSSSDGVLVGDDAGVGTRVKQAWVVLGDLRFVLDEDCSADRDTRVTVLGPTVADLAQGPERLRALLQDGAYCRIRIPLERAGIGGGAPFDEDAGTADGPDGLDGHSLLIRGQRTDRTPFIVRSRMRRELELRTRAEPFVIGGDQRALILAFDAAAWLEGLELDAAAPDASGAIVIDETHERVRLNLFEANLARSLGLFRDADADGTLDPDELGAELAATP